MKNILSIASLVVGIIGISVFLNPVLEIICGGGGLVLTIFAKDKNANMVISGIRSWGQYLVGMPRIRTKINGDWYILILFKLLIIHLIIKKHYEYRNKRNKRAIFVGYHNS